MLGPANPRLFGASTRPPGVSAGGRAVTVVDLPRRRRSTTVIEQPTTRDPIPSPAAPAPVTTGHRSRPADHVNSHPRSCGNPTPRRPLLPRSCGLPNPRRPLLPRSCDVRGLAPRAWQRGAQRRAVPGGSDGRALDGPESYGGKRGYPYGRTTRCRDRPRPLAGRVWWPATISPRTRPHRPGHGGRRCRHGLGSARSGRDQVSNVDKVSERAGCGSAPGVRHRHRAARLYEAGRRHDRPGHVQNPYRPAGRAARRPLVDSGWSGQFRLNRPSTYVAKLPKALTSWIRSRGVRASAPILPPPDPAPPARAPP